MKFRVVILTFTALMVAAIAEETVDADPPSGQPPDGALASDFSYTVGNGDVAALGMYPGKSGVIESPSFYLIPGSSAPHGSLALGHPRRSRLRSMSSRHSDLPQSLSQRSLLHVPGDAAPTLASATGASDYLDNAWCVAGPAYSVALLDASGRIGHDARRFTDVMGAALLGVGASELFVWLHRHHQLDSNHFRIFPVVTRAATSHCAGVAVMHTAVGVAISW